ncbi:Transcriptional regulatory protein SrrA [compost metagenome]
MPLEKIVIVEDDHDISNMMATYLRSEQYRVIQIEKGAEAFALLESQAVDPIDLFLLDIMLPDIDGIELCRRIRERSQLPIMMVSAKSTDVDKAIALGAGGDDYVVKPFSPIELIARVKALLRRYQYLSSPDIQRPSTHIQIQHLKIDHPAREVTVYDQHINLTKTEYDILYLLASHAGQVFSLEQIFQAVWKEQYFENNNTVMVHIARLREKIEDRNHATKIIQNIWGVGYKIEIHKFNQKHST